MNAKWPQIDLVGIPPAQRGIPQIEVTFDIDANGIVNVSAKDKATGKEQQIRIQASGGLSDDDIENMVNEAESHADEDKKRKEVVEARNHADSLVHSTETNLKEHSDKISEEDKLVIETTLEELKTLLEDEDPKPDEIKTKSDALSEQAMKLGEAMYKASQAEAEAAEGAGEEASSGGDTIDDADVVDAEFEEVNMDEDQPKEEKKKDKKGN